MILSLFFWEEGRYYVKKTTAKKSIKANVLKEDWIWPTRKRKRCPPPPPAFFFFGGGPGGNFLCNKKRSSYIYLLIFIYRYMILPWMKTYFIMLKVNVFAAWFSCEQSFFFFVIINYIFWSFLLYFDRDGVGYATLLLLRRVLAIHTTYRTGRKSRFFIINCPAKKKYLIFVYHIC